MVQSLTFHVDLAKGDSSDAMGFVVPTEVVEALGAGKRPPVIVALNGYRYRSTVAVRGGRFLLPLAREHREKAGVDLLGSVDVTLTLDAAPRTVEVPGDMREALIAAEALEAFEALAFTYRKEHVRAVLEAKGADTRARRIAKAVAASLVKQA